MLRWMLPAVVSVLSQAASLDMSRRKSILSGEVSICVERAVLFSLKALPLTS
jgi:hypothetical protein